MTDRARQRLIAALRERASVEQSTGVSAFPPEITWLELKLICRLLRKAADALEEVSQP
jgi:hypothetical protein